MKDDNNKRVGFHSIETIIKVNPQKIKKLFLCEFFKHHYYQFNKQLKEKRRYYF